MSKLFVDGIQCQLITKVTKRQCNGQARWFKKDSALFVCQSHYLRLKDMTLGSSWVNLEKRSAPTDIRDALAPRGLPLHPHVIRGLPLEAPPPPEIPGLVQSPKPSVEIPPKV